MNEKDNVFRQNTSISWLLGFFWSEATKIFRSSSAEPRGTSADLICTRRAVCEAGSARLGGKLRGRFHVKVSI
jgi:hypothetical protein